MKIKEIKKLSAFNKAMIIIIPLIILLLIASLVTLAVMYITRNFGGFSIFSPGNIVIIMALCSAILAIIGIVFAFVSAGKETGDDKDDELSPEE